MGRLSKKLVSIVATVVVASTVMAQAPLSAIAADNSKDSNLEVQEEANDVEVLEASNELTSDNGVLIQAWNWSFNEIKENLQEFKDAGYTTIQTSPAQACRLGDSWDNPIKEQTNDKPTWFYTYQPTYFTVGNAYLGTEDEFKEMCTEAHKLGLKIIVDVVANHLADCGTDHSDKVDQTLYNDARRMDNGAKRIEDWKDRDQVTQGCCIGMPDINTASETSQKIIINYLQQLAKDGADGYRFDAAKSIELPSEYETGTKSSDYWTNIINGAKEVNPDLTYYGEVLVGLDADGSNPEGYTKIMRITGSDYSQMVRYAVGYDVWQEEVKIDGKPVDVIKGAGGTEPSVKDIVDPIPGKNWGKNYAAEETVGYVETHDLYGNAGATRAMTVAQREVCWSMIASRKGILPMFFNRPVDTDFGADMYNPKGEAYKTMGERGSDDFKSKNVVAVNKFHNAMINEDEELESINNDLVFKNSRGGKGLVLSNVSDSDQKISTETNLPDGDYENYGADGGTFTVKNGTLTGTLKPMSFAVLSTVDLSGSGEVKEAPSITVKNGATTLKDGSSTNITEKTSVTIELKNAEKASYKLGDADEVEIKDGKATIDITDTSDLVVKAQNGDKDASATYKFIKVSEVEEPAVTAKLDGKAINEGSTTTIEKEAKLNLSFENTQGLSYKIDGEKQTLSDDEMKEAIKNGLDITVGKDLEAGKTQKVEVSVTNEDKVNVYTYTVKMKDPEQKADAAEILAKYNDKEVDENTTIEYTEEAALVLTFKNAVSVTVAKDKDAATSLTDKLIANGKTIYVGADAKVGDTNTVTVNAKNSDGVEVTKVYTFKKVTEVKPPVNEFKLNSVIADKTEVTEDSDITITCDATGENVKYALYQKKDDNEEEKYIDLQSSNKLTWTAEETGNYKLRVVAQSGEEKQEKVIDVIVKPKEEKKDFKVQLASDKQTIEIGQSVKLTGTALNAAGTPKFKFKYKLSKNDWNSDEVYVVAKGYSENNTIEWTPKKVGTYTIKVLAQDDNYNDQSTDKKYITSEEIIVTVTEKKNEEEKPATSTTTTPQDPTQSGDAAKTLPIVATMIASAAALVKKFKRQ